MTPLLSVRLLGQRAGVLTSPPTALYLLLGSLLATLLVLVLRSAASEQQLQRPRRRRLTRDRGGMQAPHFMAARLQLWAGGLTLLGQLLAMGSKSELLHWKDRAEASAILAVIMLLLIGLPSWAPRLFERRRCLIVGAARLALWVQPWIVNPRGMQAVFLAHPSQGVRGLLFDLWQLLLGTRTLAMFVTAIIAPLPTLPHLALALFAFERCRTASYICTACPLLRHPTWQRRIAWMHRAIDKLPLLVPEQSAACEVPLAAADAAVAECRTFVTFLQLLCGVVVPTLIVARFHAPLHDAAADEAERQRRRRLVRQLSRPPSSEEEEPSEEAGSGSWRQRCRWPLPSVQACSSRLSAAAFSAEGMLQHLCSLLSGSQPELPGSWVLTVAVWWLLLSFCWVLALALELPSAAAGSPAAGQPSK